MLTVAKQMERDLRAIEKYAREHHDGHFSIFSFTTNIRGCYGTPVDLYDESFGSCPVHSSILNLLNDMARNPQWYELKYPWTEGKKEDMTNLDSSVGVGLATAAKVWRFPSCDKKYILASHVSIGNEGGDPSSIQIIETVSGLQCAEYVEVVKPDQLAHIIYYLAKRYNDAEVAVEVNSFGVVTNRILIQTYEYQNLYTLQRRDRLTNYMTTIVGWWTDENTLNRMKESIQNILRFHPDLIRSQECLAEDYDSSPRMSALMIAYAVRAEEYKKLSDQSEKP